MNNDFITVLTCAGKNNSAGKKFICDEKGDVSCQSYDAGTLFYSEDFEINCLNDIEILLNRVCRDQKKFFVRGKTTAEAVQPIFRREHQEPYDLESVPHKWVMLDVDDLEYPEEFSFQDSSEDIVRWCKTKLPLIFHEAECVYQFSSSQNVTNNIGDLPHNLLKVHLFYWCDDFLSDLQWKGFLKKENAPVDLSLFTSVQPHYTAAPIFIGMDDPVPHRIGRC